MQASKATAIVGQHLGTIFRTLTLSSQQTKPPPEFTKTNAPAGSARA